MKEAFPRRGNGVYPSTKRFFTEIMRTFGRYKWVRDRAIPIPPRCRARVNSLDLPASPFRAPGDALAIAPGGGRSVSYAGAGRNALKLSSPRSRKWRSRNRPLSARLLRLNLMHRRRMRIQRSKRRKVLPTSENVVAK